MVEIPNENKREIEINGEENKIISPGGIVWRQFKKKKPALIGAVLLTILIMSAIFAPMLTKYDINDINPLVKNQSPSREFPLGTDQLGRDQLTRMLYGGRVSLMVGVFSVGVSVILGTAIGGIAGYFGGRIDSALMRFTELVMAFPFLPLAITISAIVGNRVSQEQKMYLVMLIIGGLRWPGLARIVRAQILTLREQEFVLAANATGIPGHKIIFRHLIPNVLGYIIVSATLGMAGAILSESGLSFLGMGVTAPTPTWGNLLQAARDSHVLRTRPWLWIPPGMAIFAAVMSINLLGDGLRDAIDPKSN